MQARDGTSLYDSSEHSESLHWPRSRTRYSSEKLTRFQALKGMTLDAAYASFAEEEIGSLEEGKKADFVILDHDILNESADDYSTILKTKVLMTVVDGKIAYGGL